MLSLSRNSWELQLKTLPIQRASTLWKLHPLFLFLYSFLFLLRTEGQFSFSRHSQNIRPLLSLAPSFLNEFISQKGPVQPKTLSTRMTTSSTYLTAWWAGGLETNSLETRHSFLPRSLMKWEGEFTTNLQLMNSHSQLMNLPPTVIDKILLKQQSTNKWTNSNNPSFHYHHF